MNTLYVYKATVLRVVDADTVILDIDLGWRVRINARVRLAYLNAPELSTEQGKAAADWLANELPLGTEVYMQSIKDRNDRFGRFLGILYPVTGTLQDDSFAPNRLRSDVGVKSYNLRMLEAGMAQWYQAGKEVIKNNMLSPVPDGNLQNL